MANKIETSTLLQEHSWRVAMIVSFIAGSIHRFIIALPPNGGFGSYVALLVSGIGVLLSSFWLRSEIYLIQRRKELPPGELGYPLIGTLPNFLLDSGSYLPRKKEKFGNIFTENGLFFQVITTAEESITWLWNSERKGFTVASWPPTIHELLGKGAIANANGKRHRALRRILEPAFTPKATRDYLDVIDQVTCKTLSEWSSPKVAGKDNGSCGQQKSPFHSSEEFKMFSLRLFFVAAFGREGDQKIMDQLHVDFKTWIWGFMGFIPYRIPGTLFYRAMAARDRILELVEDIILKFMQENPPNTKRAQSTMLGRACYGVDEEGKPMELEDLKDNILNLIFAGHDTTYASMGTAIHYLCENPAFRLAITEEVKGFQDPLDFDELKNAPILNAFLAEMWRLDPPAPGGQRKLTATLEYGGFTFRKGLEVAYNSILQGQSADLYPEPKKFDIQRFLPTNHPLVTDPSIQEAAKDVDFNSMKANYPASGGGLHSCLGSHFAKLEMRVLVTRLLQSYHIEEKNVEKLHFPINGWRNEFRLIRLKD